ncbi:hypothetical protein AX17_003830 [Amanita inopinata Kibby_2008]|nr:hypothetical protein AX17_003830 [Amanita inopinata Kibby_2008]
MYDIPLVAYHSGVLAPSLSSEEYILSLPRDLLYTHYSTPIQNAPSLFKLAPSSRQHVSSSRLGGSQSTQPSRLQPAAADPNANRQIQHRVSRTDLDFEQALSREGTLKIKESVDISALGLDMSPSSSISTPRASQPSAFFVVPPTPSPVAGPSRHLLLTPYTSPISNDVLNEHEDTDRHTNRRSIYRSTGTSSSPDLATLVRKARERGGVIPSHHYAREKRKESPPPLPPSQDRPSTANGSVRPRSSTSHSLNPPPATLTRQFPNREGRGKLGRAALTDAVPEWFTTSPQPLKVEAAKASKSSVRQKTSALLGKMLGQSSTKERMKTSLSNPLNLINPPIPPAAATYNRKDTTSGLPSSPLLPQATSPSGQGDPNEASVVVVDQPSLSDHQVGQSETSGMVNGSKRRSMGAGDVDLKKPLIAPPASPRHHINEGPRWEDTTLHGIINDFKGELSSLDPATPASLDLRDPSTPARRLTYRSRMGGGVILSRKELTEINEPVTQFTTPSDIQVNQNSDSTTSDDKASGTNVLSSILPPRSSSLQMPPRSPVGKTTSGSTSVITNAICGSPKPQNGAPARMAPRDPGRLRISHRSITSSSEPSLLPVGNISNIHPTSTTYTGSHQDLTLTRSPSSNPSTGDDEVTGMESRGKDLAARCWNEDTSFLAREKIAEWLGGQGHVNKVALHHYIALFDFSSLRLDFALRRLCSKLYLKGETQQVDRILEEFSNRYWECNPKTLYRTTSIVHAVAYSLLLLNTDLHVADLATHMSRNQFVRNTLTAIQAQLHTVKSSTIDLHDGSNISLRESGDTEVATRSKRSDSIASWNSVSREVVMTLPTSPSITRVPPELPATEVNVSSVIRSNGVESKLENYFYSRTWENEMESLLKEMYGSIKSQQILQPLNAGMTRPSVTPSPAGGVLRNRSLRGQPDRLTMLKRGSIRGLQSIITQSSASPYSSNSSIDGRTSPAPSFAPSTHELHGSSSSFLTPTLGFASNLSNTIIREAHEDDDLSVHSQGTESTSISITDEELALLGPPWAKEGMLCRKQYWESTGKRSKDKSWLDVFVVIQKGELNMFTFNGGNAVGFNQTFGGGNWLANAYSVGAVQLAHSLAHSLPPPGYNRQRPYCMVLTLANGGVYFFQAGTEELVNEWVSTCNYWAARTSKEPLAGGVSNMEYGWNRVGDPHLHGRHSDDEHPRDTDYADAISIRSGRSNRSKFGWREGVATVRYGHSPWTDRTFVNDWRAPLPPTVASAHDEEAQLEALRKHVAYLKNDLECHNELREPMTALYQPKSANAVKAQSNWEKKSQYLLTEIVKYDSYIDSLQNAMTLRLKKRGERALERALNVVTPSEPN